MATVLAATLTDTLLRRVRDQQGLAHSRDFARSCLSHAQRILNCAIGVVTESLTLATSPTMMVYSTSGFVPAAARVLTVREDGRDLAPLTNPVQLAHLSLTWFRDIGPRFEAWCPVGRDLFVVYPAKRSASTMEVKYAKLTNVLAGEADSTEMPEEYSDYIISLAECFLLLKQRDLAAAQVALKRVIADMQADMLPTRLHVQGVGDLVATGTMRLPNGQGG